ncbi:MAG: hypothetical protein ACYDH6_16085 [Acidimicrobiales bacterium]
MIAGTRMRRAKWCTVGVVALLALPWGGGPADAAGSLGPTPDGGGNYAICSVSYGSYDLVSARCTFGLAYGGSKMTDLKIRNDSGLTVDCVGSEVAPGVYGCSRQGFTGGAPTRLVGSWGATALPTLLELQPGGFADVPSVPGSAFTSGVTGVVDAGTPSTPVTSPVPGIFANTGAGFMAVMGRYAGLVAVVVGLALGGFLAVGLIRRAVGAADPPAWDACEDGYDDADAGALGHEEEADGHDVNDGWAGAGGDDGTEEPADIGEDSDDDAGNADIGDDTECIMCGAELEYGWDYNYCAECAAVS